MKKSAKSDKKDSSCAPMSDAECEQMVLLWDMRKSLAHELGHYFVALHYGGESCIRVWRSSEAIDGANKTFFANCRSTSTEPFHKSCIGWAGEIGTWIAIDKKEDPEELLVDIYEYWENCPENFSNSDQAGISAYRLPSRSLKRAIEILLKNADRHRSKVDELSLKIMTEGLSELYYPEESALRD